MSYNLTALGANSTGLLPFAQMMNTELMSGTLGIFFLLSFTAICFISFVYTTGDGQKAFIGSSFIAFTLSIFLLAMDLIPLWTFILSLVAAAVALAFTFMER